MFHLIHAVLWTQKISLNIKVAIELINYYLIDLKIWYSILKNGKYQILLKNVILSPVEYVMMNFFSYFLCT